MHRQARALLQLRCGTLFCESEDVPHAACKPCDKQGTRGRRARCRCAAGAGGAVQYQLQGAADRPLQARGGTLHARGHAVPPPGGPRRVAAGARPRRRVQVLLHCQHSALVPGIACSSALRTVMQRVLLPGVDGLLICMTYERAWPAYAGGRC